MRPKRKTVSWIVWAATMTVGGVAFFYLVMDAEAGFSYRYLVYLLVIMIQFPPLTAYLNRRKIEKEKRRLGLHGDMTLEELEDLRIEREYQEKYAKKWRLNISGR